MSATELRRVLVEHLTQQKMGLYWERNAIEHDKALNANVVLPRLVPEWSHTPDACTQHQNLIIEGDNFVSGGQNTKLRQVQQRQLLNVTSMSGLFGGTRLTAIGFQLVSCGNELGLKKSGLIAKDYKLRAFWS